MRVKKAVPIVEDLETRIALRQAEHQASINDITHPAISLLCKLGSIAVHAEEFVSPDGHHFDLTALRGLMADPEVAEWLKGMQAAAFLPVKRR